MRSLWYAAGIGASGTINWMEEPLLDGRVLGRFLAISQEGFLVMSRKGWGDRLEGTGGRVRWEAYTEPGDKDFYGRHGIVVWAKDAVFLHMIWMYLFRSCLIRGVYSIM